MVTPYFKNIRKVILVELEAATEEILVAVYWFTNHELFDMLCKKREQGVSIKLIIHNDYINNRDSGLPFQSLIEKGAEFYFSDIQHPMHNKFCVIDKRTLINGSYNWTYYAENKNHENIVLIKDEVETVAAFEQEYKNILSGIKPETKITALTKYEINEFNTLDAKDYLANDIVYQAKSSNNASIVESAFALAPNNIQIQEQAVKFGLIRGKKLTHSIGIGVYQDAYLIGAEKGTHLPVNIVKSVVTIKDNQDQCTCPLYFGDAQIASQNSPLQGVSLNSNERNGINVLGLPAKPKGEAQIKIIFQIDLSGTLRVKAYSLDNGNCDVFVKNVSSLLEN